MSGMSTGLEATNPTVVSAFHRALLTQGAVVLAILVLVATVWLVLRALQLADTSARRTAGPARGDAGAPTDSQAQARGASPCLRADSQAQVRGAGPFFRAVATREPAARRLLRIGFGLLWIFDGILQAQPSMPLGMGPEVIQPLAAASPAWVQHLDNALVTVWSYHPVTAAAAAVWIQVGIGVWLLAAPRGNWSRLGGVASVLWGLNVWVFGEAFGGIFAPGLTWLFGAPGAALFYCFAGFLIALPEHAWSTARIGRVVLRDDRRVLRRHGAAAGLAGPRILGRSSGGHVRNAHDNGPANVADAAAALSLVAACRASPASSPRTAGRSTCSPWSPSRRSAPPSSRLGPGSCAPQ